MQVENVLACSLSQMKTYEEKEDESQFSMGRPMHSDGQNSSQEFESNTNDIQSDGPNKSAVADDSEAILEMIPNQDLDLSDLPKKKRNRSFNNNRLDEALITAAKRISGRQMGGPRDVAFGDCIASSLACNEDKSQKSIAKTKIQEIMMYTDLGKLLIPFSTVSTDDFHTISNSNVLSDVVNS